VWFQNNYLLCFYGCLRETNSDFQPTQSKLDHIFHNQKKKKAYQNGWNSSKIPFCAKYSFMDHKAQEQPLERPQLQSPATLSVAYVALSRSNDDPTQAAKGF
jgi:hypothetical protein